MGIAIFTLKYYNTHVFCFREKECAVQHILFYSAQVAKAKTKSFCVLMSTPRTVCRILFITSIVLSGAMTHTLLRGAF